MADNYISMAEEFPFPKEAAQDLKLFIDFIEESGVDQVPEWFMVQKDFLGIEDVRDYFIVHDADWTGIECNSYDEDKKTMYLAGENCVNTNFLELVMPDILKHYDIREPIAFEIAYTCSKLRPGDFGGSVVVFGPGLTVWGSTQSMKRKLSEKIRKRLEDKKLQESDELLVNETWTRREIRSMLADSIYFEKHPEQLTDELVDAFGDYVSEKVSAAVDNICDNIPWVVKTQITRFSEED